MVVSGIKLTFPDRVVLRVWWREVIAALPVLALVIYLYYTWFAVSNRYTMFLYFHDVGARFDTAPFGWMTVGRYWMTALVAGGAVLIPYSAVNFVLGVLLKRYRAPVWWRVWALCAVPLLIIVPMIVMTVNDPVLPLHHAARVTVTLLIALALAVYLGELAAEHPLGFVLLLVDGIGLACLIFALRAVPGFPGALQRGKTASVLLFTGIIAAGYIVLIVVSAIYVLRRRLTLPAVGSLLVVGVNVHYLILPLFHHLFWCTDTGSWTDPDYFNYIPAAGNYFVYNIPIQVFVWFEVVVIVYGLTRVRLWLRRRTIALA